MGWHRSLPDLTCGGTELLQDGKMSGDAFRSHRHRDISALPPQLQLIDEGRAAEPTVLAAKQHKRAGIEVGEVADLARICTIDRRVPVIGARMGGLHQRLSR